MRAALCKMADEDGEASGGWTCPRCTFQNPASATLCLTECGARRGEAPAADSDDDGSGGSDDDGGEVASDEDVARALRRRRRPAEQTRA